MTIEEGDTPNPSESQHPGSAPEGPFTLAIDVGGTGLKASVLDRIGRVVADRVRVPTRYPFAPETFVDALFALSRPLPAYDRVSVGFPGVVRGGRILTAPHFVGVKGPGSAVSEELFAKWRNFDAAEALSSRLGKPTRIANDADLQGLAVIAGKGLEFVVTLGTGIGSAVFLHGVLAPHLELAQAPFRKGETYNGQIGDGALQAIGVKAWRKRVFLALDTFEVLLNFDTCYIGGGNARHMKGHVEAPYVIVDNVAGILGGIKLWEGDH
jgi:polyphosphate glucokinase